MRDNEAVSEWLRVRDNEAVSEGLSESAPRALSFIDNK